MRPWIFALTLLAAVSNAGVSFTPLVSYSSASGFIFGGLLGIAGTGEGSGALTALAALTTGGGQTAEIRAARPVQGSGWRVDILSERLVNRRFTGWGNGGDPDSFLQYDREQQRLAVSRQQYLSRAFSFEIGAELLHSTLYGREQGAFWEGSPSSVYGSTWSAGPFARLTMASYLPFSRASHTDLTAGLQSGSRVSYGSASLSTSAYLPLPAGLTAAFRSWISCSWDLDRTPFTMLPCLGPEQILRGYDSRRFYGPWRCVCNAELRRHLLSALPDRETGTPRAMLSGVLFADAGQVAEQPDGFRWDRMHADAGLGLRLLSKGAVLAADFALLSLEGLKMALGFGESF